MLGRTHMAIGALAGVAITPCLLHSSLPLLTHTHFNIAKPTLPHALETDALLVVSSIIGSTFPDFDEQNSLLSRKAEKLVQLLTFLAVVSVVMLLHLQTSMWAWLSAVVIGVVLISRANVMRKIALGLLCAGLLTLGITGKIDITGAVLLAAWTVGAMLTKHRTFTHSLLGLCLFGVGVFQSITIGSLAPLPWGLTLGYMLHMVADVPAGGIPLLWPWKVRQGVSFVKTSGWIDHLIGALALVGAIALVI
ncbi:metal-dependent hydrolase [Alicyclobacillus fodiniaquatilis]|uniref:Metal-dependent hydrolase n=1 Tax=Alicyclobacillus fodiniaquatilis TaxID=1661150 RepID=A0ABW4JFS7_9BACL